VVQVLSRVSEIDAAGERGWTALFDAVDNGHVGCVRALIRAGASPTRANEDGGTPLSVTDPRSTETLRILLARGAAVCSPTTIRLPSC
jgi:ankyrin repeat protein